MRSQLGGDGGHHPVQHRVRRFDPLPGHPVHHRVEAPGVGVGSPAVRAGPLVRVERDALGRPVPQQGGIPPAGERRDGGVGRFGVQRHGRITSDSRTRARWIRPRTASSLAPVICAISA
ncbi:hypothetical protein GCM10023320_22760 [Pseudonocardia adelaidensis]|uniref:Uncharacterized protein n=1 Tax=Pseudonocardia adelaidensis TaxID=648754 RepID=A0ABP9NHU6_9PSEU